MLALRTLIMWFCIEKIKSSGFNSLIFNMPSRASFSGACILMFGLSHSQGPAWVPFKDFQLVPDQSCCQCQGDEKFFHLQWSISSKKTSVLQIYILLEWWLMIHDFFLHLRNMLRWRRRQNLLSKDNKNADNSKILPVIYKPYFFKKRLFSNCRHCIPSKLAT